MKTKQRLLQGSGIAVMIAAAWFADNKVLEQSHSPATRSEDPKRPELAMKRLPLMDEVLKSQLDEGLKKAESLLAKELPLNEEAEDSEQEEAEVTRYAAWQRADGFGVSSKPSIPLNTQVREYEAVKAEKPKTLPGVGDQVELPLLNGESATVEIKSSVVTRNGDYSWSGHLEGYGDDYPVVVTYGDSSSFAMITTPNGSYSMESVNGVGWLYKNPSEHELSHPGVEDYLEIPGESHVH